MQLSYVAKRIGMFFLVIWLAATINFFLPRLGGQDPVRQQMIAQAALGGSVQTGLEQMIEIYNTKFGLDQPLWKQYVNYLGDMSRLDFNYSISSYRCGDSHFHPPLGAGEPLRSRSRSVHGQPSSDSSQ